MKNNVENARQLAKLVSNSVNVWNYYVQIDNKDIVINHKPGDQYVVTIDNERYIFEDEEIPRESTSKPHKIR